MKLITLSACLLITLIMLVSAIPSSIAETLDFENCQGFLSDIEIKNTVHYNGDLEITSRSATQTAKEENMQIRTMCTLTASTPDKSAAISMGVVAFSGSSPALKHYATILDSAKNQNVEIYEGKNPWKFFSAEINQGGIGKMVVSQRDVYLLSFHTVESKTSESLASEESLQNLSLLVQQKIIPFAPGSYAPPSSSKVETNPEVKEKPTQIPDWIRNNARWWSTGAIGDSDFVSGIQYLIQNGIMQIPKTVQTGESTSEGIPDWVKNNAGWWAEGQISDDDFVNGIQYLVEHGIINVEDKNETKILVYEIEGNLYPVYQFKMTPKSPDCPDKHLHATSGYTIDGVLVSFTDPTPGGCGLGTVDSLVQSQITMNENQIFEWEKVTGILIPEE